MSINEPSYSEFGAFAGRAFEQAGTLYNQAYRQRPDLRPDQRRDTELSELVQFVASRNMNWNVKSCLSSAEC